MKQPTLVIRSKDNSHIKQYEKLASSRKYRAETGLFVIESHKLIDDAIDAQILIEKVFVTEHCLAQQSAILLKLFEGSSRMVVIDNALETKMTHTKNAGGLFAVCKKLDKLTFSDTIGTHRRYIYLHALQDTGNIGTIIRTAEALGLSGVILTKGTSDPYSLKVLRASMGAVFRLPFFESEDALADLLRYQDHFDLYAAVIAPQATDLRGLTFATNSIIVIGNEGNGLPAEVVACCQHQVTIEMSREANSLNAGMAAGILMWELAKQATHQVP